jgi:hypothetical protein
VPKALREELGFAPGTELELAAVDGRLEVVVPSKVAVEDGPHGLRFTAPVDAPLTGLAVPAADAARTLQARAHDRTLITLDARAQQTYARLGVRYRAL